MAKAQAQEQRNTDNQTPAPTPGKEVKPLPTDKAFTDLTTKSAKIRYLHNLGWSTGDIARSLGIIYQHARNVLNTPIKEPREGPNKVTPQQAAGKAANTNNKG